MKKTCHLVKKKDCASNNPLGTPRNRVENGFALISALAICMLLAISSAAIFTNMLKTRVALRKEIERAQITDEKDTVARQITEMLGMSAKDAGATGFDIATLKNLLASGARRSSIGDNITVSAVDPDNTDTVVSEDIMTSSKQYQTMNFPDIRFGIFQPGTPFIGREFAFRMNYDVSEKDNLSEGHGDNQGMFVDKKGTLLIRLVEIPSQLGVEGENFLLQSDPDTDIMGSVLGKNVQMNFTPSQELVIAAFQNILSSSGSRDFANKIASKSAGDRGKTGGQFHELDASGASWYVPVGPRNPEDMYEKPGGLDTWTLYSFPYYQTDLRVSVSGDSFNTFASVIKGGFGQPDGAALPSWDHSVMGNSSMTGGFPLREFPKGAKIAIVQRWDKSTSQYCDMVEVDVRRVLDENPSIHSIYIGVSDKNMPVVLRDGKQLGRPFSVVSNNVVFVPSSFGADGYPFSVVAPKFIYGRPGHSVKTVNYNGQRVVTSQNKTSLPYPGDAIDGLGNRVTSKNYGLSPVQDARLLPPVFLRAWLIFVDQEISR